MNRIALVPGIDVWGEIFTEKHLNRLRQMGELVVNPNPGNPDKSTVAELIRDADFVITSWGCPSFDAEVLRDAKRLKLVAHAAGTVKGIVTPELIERGIRVSSANDALGVGVAETALGLTITSLKRMWELARSTRAGYWEEGKELIREMFDVTIGVVGAGRAGRHYIRLLRQFEVDIVLYDPIVSDEEAVALGCRKVGLEELLKLSDVISIHAPSIPETNHMFNTKTFALMKDDAILINTARGSLVHEEQLADELAKGRFTACIDVTEPEPPSKDHPFRSLPNVILIPHIAGAVNNGKQRLARYSIEDIRRFIAGETLDGEVNLQNLHVIA
ncbi:hydroxyacid dehydrogenase [Paenibacillus hemerocallicola]|uniref:Hydroxyacid dehydrogenase n=1 Tax=Paenibacillus hemerocallicola TaxID=1172614 RepID=A0A5C4T2A3_9BACL|nr:hydroxyacid dehydrogenase [Paenibacillus hemerocallicola]TNJ63191.1 hydroxyacid dehydrogenase [Paenibacillus hemerocallicola]